MKNNVHESALRLKQELNDSELVKEYRRLKNLIENDEEIIDLAKRLKQSAKLSNDKQGFLALKSAYENHPLIVNYKEVEAQLNEMLTMLKNIVEGN